MHPTPNPLPTRFHTTHQTTAPTHQSIISDVVPPEWWASCFGVYFGGLSVGLALSPAFAIPLSHLRVSLLSCALTASTILGGLFLLPETLPKETSDKNHRLRHLAAAEACGIPRNGDGPVGSS